MTFEREIAQLINEHSEENMSNTPAFILAQYLLACLAAWNTGVQQREDWHRRPTFTKVGQPAGKE